LDVILFGNEGGFAPNILDSNDCLRLIQTAIKNARYYMGKIKIGMDVTASEFYM
jgi:enolase